MELCVRLGIPLLPRAFKDIVQPSEHIQMGTTGKHGSAKANGSQTAHKWQKLHLHSYVSATYAYKGEMPLDLEICQENVTLIWCR